MSVSTLARRHRLVGTTDAVAASARARVSPTDDRDRLARAHARVATSLRAAVRDVVDCDRSHCVFRDDDDELAWHAPLDAGMGAAAAIVDAVFACGHGFVRRSTRGRRGPLLVQPVVGWDGRVVCVLLAERGASRPGFTAASCQAIARLAEDAALRLPRTRRRIVACPPRRRRPRLLLGVLLMLAAAMLGLA